MSKELILSLMTDAFKKENINLAIIKGINKQQAENDVQQMHEPIYKCMESVLDILLDHFPNFIK